MIREPRVRLGAVASRRCKRTKCVGHYVSLSYVLVYFHYVHTLLCEPARTEDHLITKWIYHLIEDQLHNLGDVNWSFILFVHRPSGNASS